MQKNDYQLTQQALTHAEALSSLFEHTGKETLDHLHPHELVALLQPIIVPLKKVLQLEHL